MQKKYFLYKFLFPALFFFGFFVFSFIYAASTGSGSVTISVPSDLTTSASISVTVNGSYDDAGVTKNISVTKSFSLDPVPVVLAPTATLAADQTTVSSGQSANITWGCKNIDSATMSPVSFAVSSTDFSHTQSTGPLTTATTYTLTCKKATFPDVVKTLTINVTGAPSGSISATPATCTDPCDVNVSFSSSGVVSPSPIIVNVTRSGGAFTPWAFAADSSNISMDWGLTVGTYRYCLYSLNPDWSQSASPLGCSSVVVSAPSTPVVVAGTTLTCNPAGQNAFTGDNVSFSAGGTATAPYSWSAPGGGISSGSISTFNTYYASAGTKSVTVSSGTGAAAKTATCTVIVKDKPAPVACVFTVPGDCGTSPNPIPTSPTSAHIYASPASVADGASSTITWSCGGGATVGNSGSQTGLSGSYDTGPLHTPSTFSVACNVADRSAYSRADVTVGVGGVFVETPPEAVIPPPYLLNADPNPIYSGDSSTISYQCNENSPNLATDQPGGPFVNLVSRTSVAAGTYMNLVSGNVTYGSFNTGALASSETYYLTCWSGNYNFTDDNGTFWDTWTDQRGSVAVNVIPKPTATISVNPTSIFTGESTTITWSSTNATSCTGTNFSTGGKLSGTLVVKPLSTVTYGLTCSNSYTPPKSASSSATVTVKHRPGFIEN